MQFFHIFLSIIQVPVVTSLQSLKLVSLTQVPVATLLRRLKFVCFIYIPKRHRKDASNRSVSLTYQVEHRDDVSARFGTFINEQRDNTFSTARLHMSIFKKSYQEALRKGGFKILMKSLLYPHRSHFFVKLQVESL